MDDWRGDNNFSVLVCPLYQYPKSKSQIYGQALDGNVCLFSWEHLVLFLENDIKETKNFSLDKVWNISKLLAEEVTVKNKNKNTNFHETGNKIIQEHTGLDETIFNDVFRICKEATINRSKDEIKFWKNKIEAIKQYTKEKAIEELIKAMKIKEKILAIEKYVLSLR